MTDPRVEDALVLAETALTAAQRAVGQAVVAERAAGLSTQLTREALQAAQVAHELARRAEPQERAPLTTVCDART